MSSAKPARGREPLRLAGRLSRRENPSRTASPRRTARPSRSSGPPTRARPSGSGELGVGTEGTWSWVEAAVSDLDDSARVAEPGLRSIRRSERLARLEERERILEAVHSGASRTCSPARSSSTDTLTLVGPPTPRGSTSPATPWGKPWQLSPTPSSRSRRRARTWPASEPSPRAGLGRRPTWARNRARRQWRRTVPVSRRRRGLRERARPRRASTVTTSARVAKPSPPGAGRVGAKPAFSTAGSGRQTTRPMATSARHRAACARGRRGEVADAAPGRSVYHQDPSSVTDVRDSKVYRSPGEMIFPTSTSSRNSNTVRRHRRWRRETGCDVSGHG